MAKTRRQAASCQKGYGGKDCTEKCSLNCGHGSCVFENHQQTCLCEKGFEGDYCQFPAQYCGGTSIETAKLVCLHDSVCIEEESGSFRCGCKLDNPDCQNRQRADFCNPTPPHIEYYGGMAVAAFCVNGGTCKDIEDGVVYQTCECPVEFTGPHCEFLNQEVPKFSITSNETDVSPMRPFVVLLITMLVVSILALVLFALRQMRRSRQRKTRDGILKTNIQDFRATGQDGLQHFQSNLDFMLGSNHRRDPLGNSGHSTASNLSNEFAMAGLFREEPLRKPLSRQRSKIQMSVPPTSRHRPAVIRRKAKSTKIKERDQTPKKQRMHFV